MPRRPIRWTKSDNLGRVLSERRVEGLLTAFRNIGSKTGPWPERNPDDMEAWWRAVLHDPRARRTRESTIPRDHPDASLRLDRCWSLLVMLRCESCGVSATYAVDDLPEVYGRQCQHHAPPCGPASVPEQARRA